MAPVYFFDREKGGWERLKADYARGRSMALLLDYDGTITPIRKRPGEAALPKATGILLEKILQKKRFSIAIVTGRALWDIKKLVRVPGVSFVCNHGFEVLHGERYWTHPAVKGKEKVLKEIAARLEKNLKGIPGVVIEDKDGTLSVHYRAVAKGRAAYVEEEAASAVKGKGLRVTSGKKVYEIRPDVEWGKGGGIMKWASMAGRRKALKVFMGDDQTDEDGFRAVGDGGVTIHVGARKDTLARYSLRNYRDVVRLLEKIALL